MINGNKWEEIYGCLDVSDQLKHQEMFLYDPAPWMGGLISELFSDVSASLHPKPDDLLMMCPQDTLLSS